MYTASAIAQKAHCKQAAVRYFARKNNIPKIIIDNKAVFIFDKKDYKRFLAYIKGRKPQCNEKQLVFAFYYRTEAGKGKKKDVQREKVLVKKLCTLLQKAGICGANKNVVQKILQIDKKQLERLLNKNTELPIAEDEAIDNNLYWVGT